MYTGSNHNVFNVGEFECHILYDGARSVGAMTDGPAETFIFGDAPKDELRRCLLAYGGFGSSTVLPFNYLLVYDGDHYTLVDTGCGDRAENAKHPDEPAGLLTKSLSDVGVSARDVDTVIISHMHWDHFGGASSGGTAAFPDAEYVMSRREAEHIRGEVGGWALDYLDVIDDRLRLVDDTASIGDGITVRLAPGHTPGMMFVEASSGGETLLYASDIIIHPAHVEHTDWIPSFEYDAEAASVSRARLVEEAHRRDALLFVPHIPSVLGRVEHHQVGYRWVDMSRCE
ncbi:MBL fold metallo-hydrolase [Candidatus Bathyarchaeota archaeon]|nr:MBL fold metallo-hydrolase [Candidatus Bathyarchaeota archaeon]